MRSRSNFSLQPELQFNFTEVLSNYWFPSMLGWILNFATMLTCLSCLQWAKLQLVRVSQHINHYVTDSNAHNVISSALQVKYKTVCITATCIILCVKHAALGTKYCHTIVLHEKQNNCVTSKKTNNVLFPLTEIRYPYLHDNKPTIPSQYEQCKVLRGLGQFHPTQLVSSITIGICTKWKKVTDTYRIDHVALDLVRMKRIFSAYKKLPK